MNRLVLDATVKSCDALRYTPAGIAVTTLLLEHYSETTTDEQKKILRCTITAKIFGAAAEMAQKLSPELCYRFEGALVAKRKDSPNVLLEVEKWQQCTTVASPLT